MPHKVLLTDHYHPTLDEERRVLKGAGIEICDGNGRYKTPDDVITPGEDADAIVTQFMPITGDSSAPPSLKVIVRYAIGADTIDSPPRPGSGSWSRTCPTTVLTRCPIAPWLPFWLWCSVFKAMVEAKSGGKVQVDVFPAGQLGGQRELAESAKLGNIEAAFVSDAVLSGFVPKAMIFSMPYLFTDTFDSYRLFNSDWGKELKQDSLKLAGLRTLQAGGFGFRSLTNSRRVIKSPNDAVGLKIRVMESPVPMAMLKGLGASPTPIPITELYTALQLGVIDGQENPPIVLTTYKLHEVQKYMTLNKHQLGTALVIMNEKFYQKLQKEFQAVIDKAADAGAKAWMGLSIIINEGEGLKFLNAKLDIYSPTTTEMHDFRAKMQPPAQKAIAEKTSEDFVKRSFEAIKQLR